jgi:serine/threonine-protein kinase
MAPEQALGVHVNARTDLYALGCTIYAMLTGAAPFSGDDSEVVHKHLTTPPVPLREHRTDIPQPLADLVDQLLAKDPIDRPVDAAEVNARLMALPREPTTAVPIRAEVPIGRVQPVSEIQPEARPVTSPRRGLTPLIVALIALAAIVLLAIPAYLFLTSPSSQATRQPATDGAPTAPQLSPSPQAEPVVQPSATAKPSPSRPDRVPARPTSEPAPVDPIVAMRLAIQQQVSTGNLNPDKAPDLYKKVDEIAREMNENDTTDAAKKAKELRDKLDDLLSQGQLSAGGHSTLIQRLDSITAALPEI